MASALSPKEGTADRLELAPTMTLARAPISRIYTQEIERLDS